MGAIDSRQISTCGWCGGSFNPRRGGSVQRFCRPACRTAFHTAARQEAAQSIAGDGAPAAANGSPVRAAYPLPEGGDARPPYPAGRRRNGAVRPPYAISRRGVGIDSGQPDPAWVPGPGPARGPHGDFGRNETPRAAAGRLPHGLKNRHGCRPSRKRSAFELHDTFSPVPLLSSHRSSTVGPAP
jgi:hypothetical protein